MQLSVCQSCRYGTIKENRSHCQREQVYSYLTNCVRTKALKEYVERHAVAAVEEERVA